MHEQTETHKLYTKDGFVEKFRHSLHLVALHIKYSLSF